MSIFFVSSIIIGFLLVLGAVFWLWILIKKSQSTIDQSLFLSLQQRMDSISQMLSQSFQETTRQQLAASHHMTNTVRDVHERLVKIEETNKQVLSFSGQLENLQRILTNPKQRGILGEYYLEALLQNVLPPGTFQMQYKFQDGQIVDAVVFLKEKIVPIDSKFSLENYNRLVDCSNQLEREALERQFKTDLKNRIDETSKYIRPQENTMEFAFMFIPHEAIYYDLLVNSVGGTIKLNTRDLIEYAFNQRHVVIVSPTSFLAYLQTVLQGLKALQIEEQTKEIRQRVFDLGRHLVAYEQYFQNIGKHLGTTVNQYNLAERELKKIDKDVLKITGQGTGSQLLLVDHPSTET